MSDTETSLDIIETGPLPDEEAQAEEATPEEAQEEETTEEVAEKDGDEPAEEVEASEEDGEDAAEEPPRKKRRSARKRISELTRARHDADRRAQEAEQQLAVLKANATPDAAPKQEDFQSLDEFVLASAKWEAKETVRKELETLGSNVQKTQQQAEQTARAADWEVKVEDAREKFDDFDDVVLSDTNPVSAAMAIAYAETENGADVAYHIASNPKLAREISVLSPTQAVLRIGKLSAKLAEKSRPKQTAAPNPVKTVKSGSAPQGLTPYNAKNMTEYAKARKAQEEAGQT